MNYTKIYQNILDNAKKSSRKKCSKHYFEKHHITPKCLGGDDSVDNLVLLTAKEHYVCHHILTKIYPDSTALQRAYWMMNTVISPNQNRYKSTSRNYDSCKKQIQKIQSDNWKDKTKNPNYTNSKVGEKNPMFGVRRFGKDNPFWGKSHSNESMIKMRDAKKQYYKNNENNTKDTIWINDGISNKRHPIKEEIPNGYNIGTIKKECPHCLLLVGGANAKRYHFNNCKSK